MCRTDSSKPAPNEEKEKSLMNQDRNEDIHSAFNVTTLEFRRQTDHSFQSHDVDEYIKTCCHALPCTIHGTSKYANVSHYFQPTPYRDYDHPTSGTIIDKDVIEDKKRSVTNKEYLCAQFRGRGLMARTQPIHQTSSIEIDGEDENIVSSCIGVPLPSTMAGVILSKSSSNSNQFDAISLEVETTFRTMLEWKVACDVEQLEQHFSNKKSRMETVQDWTELGASVHEPIPI